MGNRLQTDERRAQLITLGVELFSRYPYEAVSIDEISQKAGISRGLLYHYFGGKRAFYVACLQEAAQQLSDAIRPDPQLDGPERLVKGLGAYLDWVEARADAYLALMLGGMGRDPEVAAIIEATRQGICADLLQSIGVHNPGPVLRIAVRSWLGAVEAAAQRWLEARSPDRDVIISLLSASIAASLETALRLEKP